MHTSSLRDYKGGGGSDVSNSTHVKGYFVGYGRERSTEESTLRFVYHQEFLF